MCVRIAHSTLGESEGMSPKNCASEAIKDHTKFIASGV